MLKFFKDIASIANQFNPFGEFKSIFYGVIILIVVVLLTLSRCSKPPEVTVNDSPNIIPELTQDLIDNHDKAINTDQDNKIKINKISNNAKNKLDKTIKQIKDNTSLNNKEKDALVAGTQFDTITSVYVSFYGAVSNTENN